MINKKVLTYNFFFLFLGQGASGVLFFAAFAILARRLGPGSLGVISFAEVVFMFFLTMTNLGLSFIGTRDVARERGKAVEYVNRILSVRFFLGLVSLVLMTLFIFFLHKPVSAKYTAIVYGFALIPASLFLDWLFQGLEKMHFAAVGVLTRALIFLLGVLWFVNNGAEPVSAAYVFVVSWFCASAIVLLFYIIKNGVPRFRWEPKAQINLLKDSWPIGLGLFVGWVVLYFDSGILFVFKGEAAAGEYNAAYRPIILMTMAITVYFSAVFPAMSRVAGVDSVSMRKIINMTIGGGLALLLPVAVLGLYLAGPLMELVYGSEYAGSALLFSMLLWWPILVLVLNTYTRTLFSYNMQGRFAKVSAVTAIMNIGLNLVLIPYWGGVGAIVAKIGADLVAFAIYHKMTSRTIELPVLSLAVCPLIAVLVMLVFISLASRLNVWGMAVGGVLTYVAALLVCSRFMPRWRRLMLSGSN